jgi:hypothetical protein
MRGRRAIRIVAGTLFLSAVVFPSTGTAQPSRKDTVPPINIGGFVDTYFSWNFARPRAHTNQLRNFDVAENQIVLSAAEVDFQRAPEPVGFRVDLTTGSASEIINSGGPAALNMFLQAYLTAVIPIGQGLTVDAGKFTTHMGFESIKTKDNYNYSRSFLFAWAIPYYHLGVRTSYPLLDNLTAGVSVCNGWNGTDANSGKTFGTSITYAATPALSIMADWIGGPEEPDSVGSGFRHVLEGIVTLQTSDRVTIAIDGNYGTESLPRGTALWKGVALYGRYALNENSVVSARAEVYSDPQGYTTSIAQDLKEVTLTYEYRFPRNLMLRAEYRYDWSTRAAFGGTAPRNTQSTLCVGAIVTF